MTSTGLFLLGMFAGYALRVLVARRRRNFGLSQAIEAEIDRAGA